MSDYRQALINSFTESLVDRLDSDQLDLVTMKLIQSLSNYEVMERTTEIIPYDDENARILKRYYACLIIDGKSKKTIELYRRRINRFLDVIQKNLREVGTYDIRYYLACEKERGVSNRSLENYRSYLSALFQWMFAEEVISRNPCVNIKPIKYVDEVRLPFSATEIDKLKFACQSQRDRAIVELLLSSGVRVAELCNLDVSDVDFEHLTVRVRNGKGGKDRTTYINDVTSMHLKRYLSERTEDCPALLCSRTHDRLTESGVGFILKAVGAKAGVTDVHPHRFRRTFATGLASRGMSVQEIQRLLGHSNVNTTLEYVFVDDEKVKASYKQYIS